MLLSALPSLPGGVLSVVAAGGVSTIQAEASVKCFIGGKGDEEEDIISTQTDLMEDKNVCTSDATNTYCQEYIRDKSMQSCIHAIHNSSHFSKMTQQTSWAW